MGDKTKKLFILLQAVNIIIAFLILSFYSYIGVKTIVFFILIILLVTIMPSKLKFIKYFQSLLFYIQILAYYIPVAISLNYSQLTFVHWTILSLLIISIGIVFFNRGNMIQLSREEIYFSAFAFIFLLILILFFYFAPIKSEYQTKVDLKTLLLKSLYLLSYFLILYVSIKILNELRYIFTHSLFRSEIPITVFLLLIIIFSTYDISAVRERAEGCIQKNYKGCEGNITEISDSLRKKGLDNQNIQFLKGYINLSLNNLNKDVIQVLNYASNIYPYECEFFNMKVDYYRRFEMSERLEQILKDPPAPIKRQCNRDKSDGS